MMTRYRVVFSEHGIIRHVCFQEARNEREAIEFARMYSGLRRCPARADRCEENRD
jgi:hypothetical protein